MRRLAFVVTFTLVMTSLHADAQQPARATILYDAFGPASALQKDWGFAALEYDGRRILFDTENDAAITRRGWKWPNPGVPIYVPHEPAFFGGGAPKEFLAREPSLPPQMRYFDGQDPDVCAAAHPGRRPTSRL